MVPDKVAKVIVIGTGGTIAGAAPAASYTSGYECGVISAASLVNAVPELCEIADIETRQLFDAGSPAITSELLVRLSQEIQKDLDENDVIGVVVTHGTDTIEETAFFLDITIKSPKVVVLVGAMRPATSISADGPMNLLQAVSLAASLSGRERGVMVVLNDRILPARFVTKTSANSLDTFQAGDFGNLGIFNGKQPIFYYPAQRAVGWHHFDTRHLRPEDGLPDVQILYGHLDLEKRLPEACTRMGTRGIVLAGMGAGSWTRAGGRYLAK